MLNLNKIVSNTSMQRVHLPGVVASNTVMGFSVVEPSEINKMAHTGTNPSVSLKLNIRLNIDTVPARSIQNDIISQ